MPEIFSDPIPLLASIDEAVRQSLYKPPPKLPKRYLVFFSDVESKLVGWDHFYIALDDIEEAKDILEKLKTTYCQSMDRLGCGCEHGGHIVDINTMKIVYTLDE